MKKNGIAQPLALAILLALGFTVVWGVLGLWIVQVGEYIGEGRTDSENLFFRPDGTALVEHGRADPNRPRRYTDLDGNPVDPPEEADNAGLLITSVPVKLPTAPAWGEISWEQRIRSMPDGRSPAILWHFVSDGQPGGTAYFVGYDWESNACVGYLGTSGLRDSPLPSEEIIPFEGVTSGRGSRVIFLDYGIRYRRRGGMTRAPHGFVSPWDVYVLGRAGELYHADLQKPSMQIIRADVPIRSAALLAVASNSVHGTLHRLAIRTADDLRIMDERGEELRRFPIPEPGRRRELFVAETSGGEAVMYWKNKRESAFGPVEHRIYWVAANGSYREARIALDADGPDGLLVDSARAGIVLPSPGLLGGFLTCFLAPNMLEQEQADTYPQALGEVLTEFWPSLAIAQLLAGVLAVLCYRRQLRYGASRSERIVWPLFVLLMGLPGWIGYRFGRSWPVLEKCPACGDAVPRDRGECVRCEREFPVPILKGTEVFA